MNIIYHITQRISQTLNTQDIDSAIKTAVELMNEPLSDSEKKDIVDFSNQLESTVCPAFKSIHDEKITSCIWTITHWIVRSHLMIERINELLLNFAGFSEKTFNTIFTEDGKWMIVLMHKGQHVADSSLKSFYGMSLISEIFAFILRNAQMPES